MNVNARLTKLETALRACGCPVCAERERQMDATTIDEKWMRLYFTRCAVCGSQKTFRDLADSALDAIVSMPDPSGVDVRTLTDEQLHAIVDGE